MREFLNRLASFFQKTRKDSDLDAELQSHIAFAVDEHIARGHDSGAGKKRLVRQILTESLLLSFTGALVGAGLAFLGTRTLARLTTFNIPLLADVHLDFGALLFTLALVITSCLVFGLLPALQVPKVKVTDALKDQHRGSTDSRRHAWIRGALVTSEIAFACVLIVG